MLTYTLWDDMVFDDYEMRLFEIFISVLFSPITIILDLILSPVEIIAFIIWKILTRKEK